MINKMERNTLIKIGISIILIIVTYAIIIFITRKKEPDLNKILEDSFMKGLVNEKIKQITPIPTKTTISPTTAPIKTTTVPTTAPIKTTTAPTTAPATTPKPDTTAVMQEKATTAPTKAPTTLDNVLSTGSSIGGTVVSLATNPAAIAAGITDEALRYLIAKSISKSARKAAAKAGAKILYTGASVGLKLASKVFSKLGIKAAGKVAALGIKAGTAAAKIAAEQAAKKAAIAGVKTAGKTASKSSAYFTPGLGQALFLLDVVSFTLDVADVGGYNKMQTKKVYIDMKNKMDSEFKKVYEELGVMTPIFKGPDIDFFLLSDMVSKKMADPDNEYTIQMGKAIEDDLASGKIKASDLEDEKILDKYSEIMLKGSEIITKKITEELCTKSSGRIISMINPMSKYESKDKIYQNGTLISKHAKQSLAFCEQKCNDDVNCKSFNYRERKIDDDPEIEDVGDNCWLMKDLTDTKNDNEVISYLKTKTIPDNMDVCVYKNDTCETTYSSPLKDGEEYALNKKITYKKNVDGKIVDVQDTVCLSDNNALETICYNAGINYDKTTGMCKIDEKYCKSKGANWEFNPAINDYDCIIPPGQEFNEFIFGTTISRGLKQVFDPDQYEKCKDYEKDAGYFCEPSCDLKHPGSSRDGLSGTCYKCPDKFVRSTDLNGIKADKACIAGNIFGDCKTAYGEDSMTDKLIAGQNCVTCVDPTHKYNQVLGKCERDCGKLYPGSYYDPLSGKCAKNLQVVGDYCQKGEKDLTQDICYWCEDNGLIGSRTLASVNATNACKFCPTGHIESLGECVKCPSGASSNLLVANNEWNKCTSINGKCPPGYEEDLVGNCNTKALIAKQQCPAGYTTKDGISCIKKATVTNKICPPGYITKDGISCIKKATVTDKTCPPGYTYSNNRCIKKADVIDKKCNSGFTLDPDGNCYSAASNVDKTCPVGFNKWGDACVRVNETTGYAGYSWGVGFCPPDGWEKNMNIATWDAHPCIRCPSGSWSTPAVAGSPDKCRSYTDASCPAEYEASGDGRCVKCPSGSNFVWSEASNSSKKCSYPAPACQAPYEWTTDKTKCIKCDNGSFDATKPWNASDKCVATPSCPSGTVGTVYDLSKCIQCPGSNFNTVQGDIYADDKCLSSTGPSCPSGTEGTVYDLSKCIECPGSKFNTFQSDVNADDKCLSYTSPSCPSGYTSILGTGECLKCPDGTSSNVLVGSYEWNKCSLTSKTSKVCPAPYIADIIGKCVTKADSVKPIIYKEANKVSTSNTNINSQPLFKTTTIFETNLPITRVKARAVDFGSKPFETPAPTNAVFVPQAVSLLGVGTNNLLYTLDLLSQKWTVVPDSGAVISATTITGGKILGIGTDNNLYLKDTLNARWVPNDSTIKLLSIATIKDDNIIGVGINNNLYTKAQLSSPWVLIPNSGSVKSVSVYTSGKILGVGGDKLYTRNTINDQWVEVPNSGSVKAITIYGGEKILGVGTDNNLYTRSSLNTPWVEIPNSGPIISVSNRLISVTRKENYSFIGVY